MAKDEAKWAYWEKQVKDWRSSGLSRNAYCQREGLKPTTFDYWRPLIVSDHAEAKAVKQPVSGNDITLVRVALGQPLAVMAPGHPVDPPRGDAPFEAMALAPGHPVGQPLKLKSPSGWELQLPVNVDTQWLMALGQLLAVLRQLP